MNRIGFIGLGIMGKPMAKNLLKAGYGVFAFDIVKEALDEVVAAGAQRASGIGQIASSCQIIFTMLPNSPHVKEVVLGENGILPHAKAGTIIVDTSSISPLVSQEIQAECAKKGVQMLDAPVSGGEPRAIDGTLAIMVGGDERAFETARPILVKLGASVVRVGESGSGNVAKLANQIIVALNIAAVSEAMVLSEKCGVDAGKVFEAIKGGLAGSAVLNAKMPMILTGNFKPGFRIELHIKDLQNALDAAHSVGSPVPLTAEVMEMMQALKTMGKQKNDHSGLVEYYETLADIKVQQR